MFARINCIYPYFVCRNKLYISLFCLQEGIVSFLILFAGINYIYSYSVLQQLIVSILFKFAGIYCIHNLSVCRNKLHLSLFCMNCYLLLYLSL